MRVFYCRANDVSRQRLDTWSWAGQNAYNMFGRQTALALALSSAWLGNALGASRAMEEFCAYFSATFDTEAASLCLSLSSESQSTRLLLTTSSLTFSALHKPERRQVEWRLPLRSPVRFIVQCRKTEVAVTCRGRFMGAFARESGKCLLKTEAAKGVAVSDARFQPYEPVFFSDDFMRTDDADDSVWTAVRGKWQLSKAAQVSYAASPFRLQCVEGQDALYTTGHRFWHDYLCQVSVRPRTARSSVGLGFCLGASSAGHLFRHNAVERRFELVRRTAQGEELIAQRPGGLRARQWYRLGVAVCGTHVRCLVDETEVLRVSSAWFVEGNVGL